MLHWSTPTGDPWAITEPVLNAIVATMENHTESIDAISAKSHKPLENTFVTDVRDGVAIIPVVGPLFRYANFLTFFMGASSYEILAKDFTSALNNPDVKAIVLNIDSPGGEVNGCAEFANLIFEARGKKPIVAYASGDAASGAYWVASACDEIVVSETSALGSIGVVALYRNKKQDDGEGSLSRTEIVS
ncbi:MAG: ClpP class serine protease, partial [Gammaproteobacteria bacterium]